MIKPVTVGAYRNDITLELHSKQALKLAQGRSGDKEAAFKWQRYAVRGLKSFDHGAKILCAQANADESPAQEGLILLDEKISHAKQRLQTNAHEIATLLQDIPARASLTICESEKPVELSFRFESPYGFQAACLIALYDEIVGQVETARRNGLIRRKNADQCIFKTATSIRTVLSHPSLYRQQAAEAMITSEHDIIANSG